MCSMRERGWSIDTVLKLEHEMTHIQSTLLGPNSTKPENIVMLDPELSKVLNPQPLLLATQKLCSF
eukprot:SAG31_NODE_236_length_19594_cov_7.018620_19_plen_66_part_00